MYDVWFLRINVSDGIDYALANLFYTRIISSEASYRIFLYMRMPVEGNGHNIHTIPSFLVVCHDIACPSPYATTNDIRRFKIWSAKKNLHLGQSLIMFLSPINIVNMSHLILFRR